MSLRKITEKIDEKNRKIQFSLDNALKNDDSMLFCDNCKARLGITKMIFSAMKVKQGQEYYVFCKCCGHTNKRIKGELGSKFDKDWDCFGV